MSPRHPPLDHFILRAACCAALLLAPAGASAQQIWDPPSIPAIDPREELSAAELVTLGRLLFRAKFNRADGAGRPMATGDSKPTIRVRQERSFDRLTGPDANSCAGCHNDPFIGGSGDFVANVFVGAHFTDPPTNAITPAITNERNTISLFGGGAIEMVAREMTRELQDQRWSALHSARSAGVPVTVRLETKGVEFGRFTAQPDGSGDVSGIEGVDFSLVVKPFGVKGIGVSLREFVNFTVNHHHGIQTDERFGWARTGVRDFDGDGFEGEFSLAQVTALTAFQAALPPPTRVRGADAAAQARIALGERRFADVGCTTCHRPSLPLGSLWFFEPNPFNRPGTATPSDLGGQIGLPFAVADGTGVYKGDDGQLYVAAFTDLKRHVICDAEDPFFCNEERSQDFVPTDQFLTTKLWDAGSSAPYGHRGDLSTLSEAIVHHSGEAKAARAAFMGLPDAEKSAIIAFLQSLQVVTEDPDLTGWR